MTRARWALAGWTLGLSLMAWAPVRSATLLVESLLDNSLPGSLRSAVTIANLTPNTTDTIVFELGSEFAIQLASALPALSSDLIFDGRSTLFPGVKGPSGVTWLDVGSHTAKLMDLGAEGGVISIGAGGSLEFDRATAFDLDVAITGAGEFIKSGDGRLTLLQPANHSGGTRVEAGRLRGDTSTLVGNFDLASGAVLEFQLPLEGGATGAADQPVFFLNSLSGAGALVMSGSDEASLVLTGSNLHTGGTTVENGTLVAAAPHFLPGDVQIEEGATLSIFAASDDSHEAILSGTGRFLKMGAGNLTLTGSNTLTGTFQVDAGALTGTAASLTGDVALTNADNRLVFDQSTNGSYTGDVSGNGEMEKTGAGLLTLTGSTSHTGGTRIIEGTLRGSTASLRGEIELAAGTALEFDQIFDGTLSDVITADSSAAIRKLGSGRLTLTSDQTYLGSFEVVAGRLELEADLAGDAAVEVDGTLGGSGTVTGDLNVQGSVAPSDLASPLQAGSASFEAGSQLRVTLNDSGQDASTKLRVTGNAELNGGEISIDAEPGQYANETHYAVLEAGSTSGVGFSGTQDDFAFLTFQLTNPTLVDPTVRISVTRDVDDLGNYADTENQQAVVGALEEAFATPTPDFDAVTQNLIVVRNDDVAGVLDGIGGDVLSAPFAVRLANQRRFRDLLSQRFTDIAGGGAATPRPTREALRLASAWPAGERDFGGWFDAFGVFGGLDGGNQGSAGIDFDVFGPTAGIDLRLGDALFVGAAAGYSRGHFESDSGTGRGDLNIAQVALYGGYASPRLQVGLSARYAHSDISSRRAITISELRRTARAEFAGSDVSISAEGAWTFRGPGGLDIQPLVGFDWDHLVQDAFDETGAGSLDLEIAGQTVDSLVSTVGVRLSRYYIDPDYLSLLPDLTLAWLHEFGDTDRAIQARLSGVTSGGQFTVHGAEMSRDSAQIGAGWQAQLTDRAAMSIHYDARVGSDFLDHAVAFTVYASW